MVVDETYFEPLVHPDFTTEQVDKKVKDLSLSAEADLHQEALDNLVYGVAGYIIGLAGRTPFEKQRGLVEFVVKLQEVVCHNDDGEELKSQGMVVWKELPTFGWEVRDKWNFDFKDLMDPKTGFERKHAQECHNWASFLAQLTVVAYQKSVWDLDYSQFALWDLRSALEEQHPPESEAVECRTYQTSAILQAAEWMLHAPEVIRDLCKEQKAFPDKVGRPGNKYFVEHPEWNGFNEERWRLWKGSFRDAQSWVVGDDAKKKVKLVLERIRDL